MVIRQTHRAGMSTRGLLLYIGASLGGWMVVELFANNITTNSLLLADMHFCLIGPSRVAWN